MCDSACISWLGGLTLRDIGAIGTLIAASIAAVQLAQLRAQRDVADSFAMVERIDSAFTKWFEAEDSSENPSAESLALESFMTTLEVTAMLLNRRKFGSSATFLLQHQVISTLLAIRGYPDAVTEISEGVKEPGVYEELRVLLVKRYQALVGGDGRSLLALFFRPREVAMLRGQSASARFRRFLYIRFRRLSDERW